MWRALRGPASRKKRNAFSKLTPFPHGVVASCEHRASHACCISPGITCRLKSRQTDWQSDCSDQTNQSSDYSPHRASFSATHTVCLSDSGGAMTLSELLQSSVYNMALVWIQHWSVRYQVLLGCLSSSFPSAQMIQESCEWMSEWALQFLYLHISLTGTNRRMDLQNRRLLVLACLIHVSRCFPSEWPCESQDWGSSFSSFISSYLPDRSRVSVSDVPDQAQFCRLLLWVGEAIWGPSCLFGSQDSVYTPKILFGSGSLWLC